MRMMQKSGTVALLDDNVPQNDTFSVEKSSFSIQNGGAMFGHQTIKGHKLTSLPSLHLKC